MFEEIARSQIEETIEIDQYTRLVDQTFFVFFTYVLPPICAFGIVTNILNIIVFSSKRLKDDIFKYFKMKSLSNIIYLLNAFFIFSVRCGNLCELEGTFASQFYFWLFYGYVKGIAAMFTIFITILVSVLRLSIITGIKICKLPNYKITSLIIFIISAIIFSPNFFTRQIFKKETFHHCMNNSINCTGNSSTIVFLTTKNSFGKNTVGQLLVVVVSLFRGCVCAGIIIVINLTSKIILTRKMKKSARDLNQKTNAKYTICDYFSKIFIVEPVHDVILVSYRKRSFDETKSNPPANRDISKCTKAPKLNNKRKKIVKKKEKASRNLSFLVITISILFVSGNMPNTFAYVYYTFSSAEFDKMGNVLSILTITCNTLLYITHGFDIFVYYLFNKQYRDIFNSYFFRNRRCVFAFFK